MMQLISSLGLLLIAVATLIPILSGGFPESPLYKYLFSAGALVCLAAALFRWYPGSSPRDWLAFTLAGATIRIIVFVRGVIASRKKA